ncbi:MAG: SDR family oxidoreductase [Solirubrobacteraceae bacterium]|nr:SDR family oxidoreductase [Solirubrobacteraceae bacterium]
MGRNVNGKVVLITGAARGIGAQTARVLAERGARVSLVGLEPERLEALAGELDGISRAAGHRPKHAWFTADVTDQEAVDAAVQGTVDALGRIDVVVANAGIANNGTVAVNPPDALVRTVDVNLNGVIRTVSAALPHVVDARGYVLVVASLASFTALPGMAAYCASKAGAEAFANVLRLEVAHKGVKVGSAHPSWIDTDLVRDIGEDLSIFEEVRRRLPGPLGSTTSVEECADALADGIARRSRRIYVPGSLVAVQNLRTVINNPLTEIGILRQAAKSVPRLEDEVRRVGRAFGRRTVGTDDRAA